MTKNRRVWGWGAALAGLTGGAALAVYTAVMAVVLGGTDGGSTLQRLEAAVGFSSGMIAASAFLHIVTALGWGMAIGAILHTAPRALVNVSGTLGGIVIWAVMYEIALPLAGFGALATALPTWVTLIGCGVFALTTSFTFLPWMTEGREAQNLREESASGALIARGTASRTDRPGFQRGS